MNNNGFWLSMGFGVAAIAIMLTNGGGMWKTILELSLMALCVLTHWLFVRCPKCRKWIGMKCPRYCPHCGAYIDW